MSSEDLFSDPSGKRTRGARDDTEMILHALATASGLKKKNAAVT